jgi:hypothetical protein
VAKISIDGTEVAQGGFILPAWGSVDIERFVIDGNLQNGRKFRFVSLNNPAVQDPTNCQNGLISVEFELEQEQWAQTIVNRPIALNNVIWRYNTIPMSNTGNAMFCSSLGNVGIGNSLSNVTFDSFVSSSNVGATVEGSNSNQTFGTDYVVTDPSTRKILQLTLRAPVQNNAIVNRPVTVNDTRNKFCSHCGTRNRQQANYCMKCGLAFVKF